ncbi:MAG TPA: hypothetical protein VMV92_13190 [Streptosporangiaceae bacterium]|nr:hypothetical protein [Streptosporangiaceae bacterium]
MTDIILDEAGAGILDEAGYAIFEEGAVGAMAVVYSSDCPAGLKRVTADSAYVWQCDGTADQVQVNDAINAVAATGQTSSAPPSGGGGSVILVGYNFNFSAPAQIQSWVDLSGAFGWKACQINAASGFSGTALIEVGQTYTEYTRIHDLCLVGSGSGSEHGIYYNSQTDQTPFTDNDPCHNLNNLVIRQSGGAALYFNASCRVSMVGPNIRIHSPGTYGVYGNGLTDSQIIGVQTLGSGSDGFYVGSTDCIYSACHSYNSNEYGWNIASSGLRSLITGCHAEDSSKHNWFVQASKLQLVGCTSDSAGLGNANTYDGFNIVAGGTSIYMTGCQSFDRNASPHQRYGVYMNGTTTQSRIQCSTYNNDTGSFGGTTTPGTGSAYDVFGT